MSKVTIMICDDNEAVHESLSAYLQQLGMDVLSVYSGTDALETLRHRSVDLIILDVMLPGVFGTEVCRRIRRSSNVPIIMLSAKGEELDRILGLELGADDYVTKPFSPREVATRVQVVLKRAGKQREDGNRLSFCELQIDLDALSVHVGDELVECTPKERALLTLLVKNAGTALSRERIMNEVWGYDYYGDTRSVDTVIKRLRQKLPEANTNFRIASVYGMGYRLEEKLK